MDNTEYTVEDYKPPRGDLTVKEWLVILGVMTIPLVNVIVAIVWATSSGGEKVAKTNYAKAWLIYLLIMMGFSVVVYTVIGYLITLVMGEFYF